VVIVQLDEDPNLRMVGNVVESADAPLNGVEPHEVEIGQTVQAVFSPVGDMFLPRWVRV